jgi:predicted dehydrogenase
MTDEIRIGLIGCGGIMHRHVQDLEKVPEAHIIALMDTAPAQMTAYKQRYGRLADAAEYVDWQKMLDEARPDGVVIASPHTVHYDQVMGALDRGMSVLVEKPLVCRIEHAVQVVRKVRQTGLVLGIAYQRHYEGSFRYMRKAVLEGAIGPVQAVACYQCQGWRAGTLGKWRQVPDLSGGGQLNDSGSHLVDIMLWMTGLAAETVSAQIDNRGTPVDINAALSIRFRGGAVGTLTIVGDFPAKGMWEDISIMGQKGGFHLRHGGVLTQFLGPDDAQVVVDASRIGGGSISQNFIRSIQGREPPAAPAECGLRVIELTEAAWQSAAQGGAPVTVPRTDL